MSKRVSKALPSVELNRHDSLPDWQTSLAAALPDELCPAGRRLVLGEGPPTSILALVGEAPGAEEDRLGRPFVGQAGRLFDRLLEGAGIARDSAWVTNTVKCRPTKGAAGRLRNRPPRPSEMRWWRPWLLEELRLVDARVVVCFGRVAAGAVVGEDIRLSEERGHWFPGPHGARALITFHPAYLLRLPEPQREQTEELVRQDLARAAAEAAARRSGEER